MNRTIRSAAAVVLGSAVALAIPALAQEQINLTASLYVPPQHPVARAGYEPFVETLKNEHGKRFDVKYFPGGGLLGAKATLGGLRDGIAQVGMLPLTYFPAELPHAQLVADMALMTPDNLVASLAVSEFNMLHCPECQEEFAEQGMVYTGTYSTAPYTIISMTPIRAPEDLKGKKMRVPGSLWSRWAQEVGGVEVNVPSSEMYEGLSKGALDIAIQSPGGLRSYGLWDVAKYNTLLNLGTYHSLATLAFSKSFWEELSPEERELMFDMAAEANIGSTMDYTETDEEVLAEAENKGIEIIEAGEELKQQKEDFAQSDLKTVAELAKNTYGIADAETKIETLLSLFDKWQKLVEPIQDDKDKVVALFKEEVYDKLDPKTYGLQ